MSVTGSMAESTPLPGRNGSAQPCASAPTPACHCQPRSSLPSPAEPLSRVPCFRPINPPTDMQGVEEPALQAENEHTQEAQSQLSGAQCLTWGSCPSAFPDMPGQRRPCPSTCHPREQGGTCSPCPNAWVGESWERWTAQGTPTLSQVFLNNKNI